MTRSRTRIHRAEGTYPLDAYAHAVLVDRTLYVSGQVPLDEAERTVGVGDVRAQAERVFQNLAAVLRAVRADMTDVVKVTTYLVDMRDVPIVREVRQRAFGAAKAALTTVAVASLLRPEFRITIDAIAELDDGA